MLKRFLAIVALLAAFGQAFAAVDINAADEAALRGIKGIGPAKAKAILDERAARGPFKDAGDLAQRVKGFGGQTLERMQAEGLAIGSATGAVPAAQASAARPAPSAQKNSAAVAIRK